MRKNFLFALFILISVPFGSYAAFSSKDNPKAATEAAAQPSVSSVPDALKEFKSLSRHERKERIKDAKKAIKQYKLDKKAGSQPSTNTLLLVILAILLPPLAVYLHEGQINGKFWLDLILTLLFFVPGIIYALIVILGKS
jgi:uncharacterized membrane protein YqaE (UPF0057 family)